MDESGMSIDIYRTRGKEITYVINSMRFIDEYTIVADGESGFLPYDNGLIPTTYIFKFGDGNITLDLEMSNDGDIDSRIFYKVKKKFVIAGKWYDKVLFLCIMHIILNILLCIKLKLNLVIDYIQ